MNLRSTGNQNTSSICCRVGWVLVSRAPGVIEILWNLENSTHDGKSYFCRIWQDIGRSQGFSYYIQGLRNGYQWGILRVYFRYHVNLRHMPFSRRRKSIQIEFNKFIFSKSSKQNTFDTSVNFFPSSIDCVAVLVEELSMGNPTLRKRLINQFPLT